MSISPSILTCSNLSIGYDKSQLVNSIDLSAAKGDLIALMGLNGTGKTTFFKTILKEIPALNGDILLQGDSIREMSSLQELVSIVYTDRISIFGFTVRDMVSMGRMPHTNMFGKLTKVDNEIVDNKIHLLGLQEIAETEINKLSDGQFQKVMIARALAQETALILLDEPAAFLDIKNKKMIHSLLGKLASEQDKTIIVSTHNLDFCKSYCNKVWLLKNKVMVECTNSEISESTFD